MAYKRLSGFIRASYPQPLVFKRTSNPVAIQVVGLLLTHERVVCRRKGMSSEVTVSQYFDDQMLLELARQDADLQGLF